MSSKDSSETWQMHPKSSNVEVMIGFDKDEIIKEFLDTNTLMKGNDFVFG